MQGEFFYRFGTFRIGVEFTLQKRNGRSAVEAGSTMGTEAVFVDMDGIMSFSLLFPRGTVSHRTRIPLISVYSQVYTDVYFSTLFSLSQYSLRLRLPAHEWREKWSRRVGWGWVNECVCVCSGFGPLL